MNRSTEHQDPFKRKVEAIQLARRKKFEAVNQATGDVQGNIPLYLTAVAGCLTWPLLTYVMLYYVFVTGWVAVPLDTVLITLFILYFASRPLDIFLAFIYDKLTKRGLHLVIVILTGLGAAGLCVSFYFFFSFMTETTKGFIWACVGLAVSYPFANLCNAKNTLTISPSNENKNRLYHFELLIQVVYLAVWILFPIIVDLIINGGCNCETQCETHTAPACVTCFQACDTFANFESVKFWSLFFTIVAGLAAVAQAIWLKTRSEEDETHSAVPSTFISRSKDRMEPFAHILKWTNTFDLVVYFTMGTYLAYFVVVQKGVDAKCLGSYVDTLWGGYVCTKSFMIEIGLMILLFTAVLICHVAEKYNRISWVWRFLPLLLVLLGVMFLIDGKLTYWESFVLLVIFCIHLSTVAFSKLVFANTVTYDEYSTGIYEPYIPSHAFIDTQKVGFLIGVAFGVYFQLAEFDANHSAITPASVRALGFLLIIGGGLIFLGRMVLGSYDLEKIDLVHLAIQKNADGDTERWDPERFKDPIRKEEFRRPIALVGRDKGKLVQALRELSHGQQVTLLAEPHKLFEAAPKGTASPVDQIRKGAKITLIIAGVVFVGSLWFTIAEWTALENHSVWWDFVCLFVVTMAFAFILHAANTLRVCHNLEDTAFYGASTGALDQLHAALDFKEYGVWNFFSRKTEQPQQQPPKKEK